MLKSNLVFLPINEKSLDFSDFMERILSYCDLYFNHSAPIKQSYEISIAKFGDLVEK